MPKDALARRQIKELEGAIAIVAESNVRMSALVVKCSRAFEALIEKGVITNDEINKAISEESNSDTDSENPNGLQIQSSDSREPKSDS